MKILIKTLSVLTLATTTGIGSVPMLSIIFKFVFKL